MEFYERASGARLHANFIRPGGISQDIPFGLASDIYNFIQQFVARIDEIEELLTECRIWKYRLVEIGIIRKNQSQNLSFSGPMLRSSGILWDLRINQPYEVYGALQFKMPIGNFGDCYDRYLIRIEEMRQSLKIIFQCLNLIPEGLIKRDDFKAVLPYRKAFKYSMEHLIHHFKLYSQGFSINKKEIYVGIESPKGEFGISLITTNKNKPYRCKIRAPGFLHLQGIDLLARNHLIADIVAIIGSQDIVFGEIDR